MHYASLHQQYSSTAEIRGMRVDLVSSDAKDFGGNNGQIIYSARR